MTEDWQNAGFGLYLHWPFCQSKCPYCDFNSHVWGAVDQQKWAAAYVSEIDRIADQLGPRSLKSIYFGGGTPSLMLPETVDAILQKARIVWPFANDIEITLEANPTSVEAGRFAGYRDAGVNRISMGIQALNDADLRKLGRLHTVSEARTAFDIARTLFERISFDLIYARQDQTLADWSAELQQALSMAADHLSLYQLTIESGTAFHDRLAAGGLKGLPGEDLATDMYELTQSLCDAAGFQAYEVSNHAKTACFSRHNLIYWQAGDYAGIGPGAHGRLTIAGHRFATETPDDPQQWIDAVNGQGSGESTRNRLTGAERADEYLMMGLRVNDGIDLGRYGAMSGRNLDAKIIKDLHQIGVISTADNRLFTTPRGRPVLNAIIRELLTGQSCD